MNQLAGELEADLAPPKMLAEDSPKVYMCIIAFCDLHTATRMNALAKIFYETIVPRALIFK